MTPKEKAKELVEKFIPYTRVFYEVLGWEDDVDSAKQCALIAVDEILKGIVPKYDDERYTFELGGNQFYWQEVKQEIEKL